MILTAKQSELDTESILGTLLIFIPTFYMSDYDSYISREILTLTLDKLDA